MSILASSMSAAEIRDHIAGTYKGIRVTFYANRRQDVSWYGTLWRVVEGVKPDKLFVTDLCDTKREAALKCLRHIEGEEAL